MSIDEIRQQKALVLLECKEAEDRVENVHRQLKHLSETLERTAHLLDPDQEKPLVPRSMRAPNLNSLEDGHIRRALDYDAAIRLATEMAEAIKGLAEAQQKKREFGL